ncbi:MAG: diguanylate cyclase, partial [Alphaproteobacteria bacterium]
QAGDDCLRQLAAALKGSLRRPRDLTARYGGEELAAILPATDASGALKRAEVVRRAVQGRAIPHSGSSHGVVTISVGVATLEGGADLIDVVGLIHGADTALYQAKANGRNKVVDGTALPQFSATACALAN